MSIFFMIILLKAVLQIKMICFDIFRQWHTSPLCVVLLFFRLYSVSLWAYVLWQCQRSSHQPQTLQMLHCHLWRHVHTIFSQWMNNYINNITKCANIFLWFLRFWIRAGLITGLFFFPSLVLVNKIHQEWCLLGISSDKFVFQSSLAVGLWQRQYRHCLLIIHDYTSGVGSQSCPTPAIHAEIQRLFCRVTQIQLGRPLLWRV